MIDDKIVYEIGKQGVSLKNDGSWSFMKWSGNVNGSDVDDVAKQIRSSLGTMGHSFLKLKQLGYDINFSNKETVGDRYLYLSAGSLNAKVETAIFNFMSVSDCVSEIMQAFE